MVTDIVNADLGRTRCRVGRHLHHHGAKPGACRMGRRKWKEFDHDLCDAWPWRSLLRCKHDSTPLSPCPVYSIARGHLGDARATLTALARSEERRGGKEGRSR